jgi:hypothetical protein
MNKPDLGQAMTVLANFGVLVGIVFLVVELRQNNELMRMEASATLSESVQEGWGRIASDPELVEMLIKDRSGGPLSEAEELRLGAWWMGYLYRLEWQHTYFPESGARADGLRRIHEAYPSFRKTWSGPNPSARASGKDNFSPAFVAFVDETITGSEPQQLGSQQRGQSKGTE